jgi:ketosteroid isomerase-like protein
MKMPETNIARHLFKNFCNSYKNRDLPALLNLFSEHCNLWGTGIDEYRVGLKQIEEQLKRDWSQSDKGELEIVSFVSTPHDPTWAAATCNAKLTIDGQDHIFEHLRATITVESVNGTWKISHMHASFPDYRNPENHSFPVTGCNKRPF